MAVFNPVLSFSPLTPLTEESSVQALRDAYCRLSSMTSKQHQLHVEEQKLQILHWLYAQIKQHANQSTVEINVTKPSKLKHFKSIAYYGLISFGVLEDLGNSYYFGITLLALIPGLAGITLISIAVAYAILDSLFFLVFESVLLKEALGLDYAPTGARRMIDIHDQQLKTLTSINQLLSSLAILEVDSAVSAEYFFLAQQMNAHMRQQYLQLPVMRESIFMQCIKGVVFAFGAVSSMAGSYFLISAFMAMLAPALLGTPVGWTLLALTIGIGLIFHYMMDNSGMSRVINRDYPSYQALKADWEQFSKTYHDDLNGVYAIKQRVEKKLSVDAETQTELLSYRFFSAANSELIAETPSDSVDYLEIRPA